MRHWQLLLLSCALAEATHAAKIEALIMGSGGGVALSAVFQTTCSLTETASLLGLRCVQFIALINTAAERFVVEDCEARSPRSPPPCTSCQCAAGRERWRRPRSPPPCTRCAAGRGRRSRRHRSPPPCGRRDCCEPSPIVSQCAARRPPCAPPARCGGMDIVRYEVPPEIRKCTGVQACSPLSERAGGLSRLGVCHWKGHHVQHAVDR